MKWATSRQGERKSYPDGYHLVELSISDKNNLSEVFDNKLRKLFY